MLRNLIAITRNTFIETIRQPVYGVVIAAGILLLIFGPSLSMFTIDDDNKLLKDTGLSTLLVAGLFLAVFSAATVVYGEIENKTVLTIITKKVDRWVFILGKYFGVAGAVLLGQILLALVLMIVIRHGVLQTAADESDKVVLTLGIASTIVTIVAGMGGNYFYRWRFTTTAVFIALFTCVISIAIMAFIDPNWHWNPAKNGLDSQMVSPILLTMMASLILTAVAIAAASRLGLVLTLLCCSLFFVLGISLQPWLGPISEQIGWQGYLASAVLTIFPCLNFYMVTNAIYQSTAVPLDYLAQTGMYAGLYVTAVLLFTIVLFRHREIS